MSVHNYKWIANQIRGIFWNKKDMIRTFLENHTDNTDAANICSRTNRKELSYGTAATAINKRLIEND